MSASETSPTSSLDSSRGERVGELGLCAPSSSPIFATSQCDEVRAEKDKHPKGKRKRTAAKDKTILENAYRRNPKPDKAARLDLVSHVSLTEKEVQIWFQNRRQNDRRKSRPLSTEEIAALRSGGMQLLSSDPVTSSSQAEEKTSPVAPPMSMSASTTRPGSSPAWALNNSRSQPSPDKQDNNDVDSLAGGEKLGHSENPSPLGSRESCKMPSDLSASFPSSTGYLSNRWHLSSSFSTPSTQRQVDDVFGSDALPSSPPTQTPTDPNLSTCNPHVRLSLSLEGKAELVSNEQSPSRARPPKIHMDLPRFTQSRPRPLQRSRSTISSVTLPPISVLTEGLPPKLGRGRSRDAQAWELCCDSDQRDELTTQAENESSGSAVAAISLLRSQSSTGVLQPSSSKRNAPPLKPTSRPEQGNKKPRLSRTMSSNAILDKPAPLFPEPHTASKLSIVRSPGGDSDKENWSPGRECNPPRHVFAPQTQPQAQASRPDQAQEAFAVGNARCKGRVLGEHHAPWLLDNSRASTAPLMRRRDSGKELEIYEDDSENRPPPGESCDVEKFMRGEVSPSKKGDMDCIAGLLSLSQGNWGR